MSTADAGAAAVFCDRPRTYKRRTGRVGTAAAAAYRSAWPRWGVPVNAAPLDLAGMFGRVAPVILEVGFGMGEATAEMAAAQPERDVLGVDVHIGGVGNLLRLIEAEGLTNVRVVEGDALTVLRAMLPPRSLAGVRVFFPDPWAKTRHAKRRLVDLAFLDLVAARLASGGLVHLATDDVGYAARTRELLVGHAAFELAPVPPWRAHTRFEQRARAKGRAPVDVAARKGRMISAGDVRPAAQLAEG